MITFGIVTLNNDSESKYFYEIAVRAHKLGITCYRFIPSNINPISEQALGERFDSENNTWVTEEFPLPNILYDRCFYSEDSHSKQCHSIVNWLKKRNDIIFLGYGLPNKLEQYSILKESSLKPYLIETKAVKSPEQILSALKIDHSIIMKPANGAGGFGIYLIEKASNGIHVKTEKRGNQISHLFNDFEKLLGWLKRLISDRDYLWQPFVHLRNHEKQPFDIRCLLQKNANGEWVIIGKGVRTGLKDGILSNLHAGATVTTFEEWIQTIPIQRRSYLHEEINEILTALPQILEASFNPLFEIGVDIGFAADGSLWILDVNSKPGRKVILRTQPVLQETLYNAPLLFAKNLYNNHYAKKERLQ